MTAVDEFMDARPQVDAGIRRDQWGRYLLPHPETGKEQAWTRATTLAGTLADRFGLEQWEQRNIVLGIGARQDLYAQAAAAGPDDKATLNGVIKQAKEAAASKAGANLGSAIHQFTERLDQGEQVTVPEPWRADVDAYRQTMAAHHITPVPGWVERVVIVPDIGVAGTIDRLLTSPHWAAPRIGDVKTGKDIIRYGVYEIALQLAIYAHATHWWDPTTTQLHPVTEHIDGDTALVMHVPTGQGECTLIEIDIQAGWDAVQTALAVRNWRKRKDLAQIATPPADPVHTGTPGDGIEARVDWLRQRVRALPPAARTELAKLWPHRVPRRPEQITSHSHIDQAAAALTRVEAAHRVPFHNGDPGRPAPQAEPEPQPQPPASTAPDPAVLATQGQALLDQFDQPTARAIAQTARCHDRRLTPADLEALEAVAAQIAAPDGVVIADWQGPQPDIVPTPGAAAALAALHGSKGAALTAAKIAARRHGLTVPRSLSNAAETPLLAALTAASSNTPPTTANGATP